MAKIGRPPRLIAYDTDINIKRREHGVRRCYRFVRLRTAALCRDHRGGRRRDDSTRWRPAHAQAISVIHDRNPIFVRLSDGALRNAYTVRIANKRPETREFALSVTGLPGSLLDFVVQTARRRPVRHRGRPGPDARGARARHRLRCRAAVLDADHLHLYDVMTGERAPAAITSARPAGGMRNHSLTTGGGRPLTGRDGSHLPDRLLRRGRGRQRHHDPRRRLDVRRRRDRRVPIRPAATSRATLMPLMRRTRCTGR